MVIKKEIAYGIVESIADLKKGDHPEDFTVIVDDISIRCHSFILAACSHYFRALFCSGMRESLEQSVKLKEISHATFTEILSALYTGYDVITEDNVFSLWQAANLLQICFLERECEAHIIQNLSLDNYEEVYRHASMLCSSSVLDALQDLMVKHFDTIRRSQVFLEISFEEVLALVENDNLIVTSEDSVIEAVLRWTLSGMANDADDKSKTGLSKEESVEINVTGTSDSYNTEVVSEGQEENVYVEASDEKQNMQNSVLGKGIFKASNNCCKTIDKNGNKALGDTETTIFDQDHPHKQKTTNQELLLNVHDKLVVAPRNTQRQTQFVNITGGRQTHLAELMSATRMCLITAECLEMLLENAVVMGHQETRKILLKAVNYQLQVGLRHGHWPRAASHRNSSEFIHGVVYVGNNINLRYFPDGKRYQPTRPFGFDGNGCVTVFDNQIYLITPEEIFAFRKNTWQTLLSGTGYNPVALPHGNSIYLFHDETGSCHRFMPLLGEPKLQPITQFPHDSRITAVVTHDKLILVFSHETNNDQMTVIHCLDPKTETWSRLDDIQGPAPNVISFRDDSDTYLIQSNGNMWKVTGTDTQSLKVNNFVKLFNFQCTLYGASLFRQSLYLYGGTFVSENAVWEKVPCMIKDVHYEYIERKVSFSPLTMPKKIFPALCSD